MVKLYLVKTNSFLTETYFDIIFISIVEIESNQPIKGIFVQGRKMNGTEPLGTFINIPSNTHLVKCPTVCERK